MCEKYFMIHNIPNEQLVEITSLYLGEKADIWCHQSLAKFDILDRKYFMKEFCWQFEGPSRKNLIEKFTKLFQIGIVLNYLEHFEYLCSLMNAENPTLLERFSYPPLSVA